MTESERKGGQVASPRDAAILAAAAVGAVAVGIVVFGAVWASAGSQGPAWLALAATLAGGAAAVRLLAQELLARPRRAGEPDVAASLAATTLCPWVIVGRDGRGVWANAAFRRDFPVDFGRPLAGIEKVFRSDPHAHAAFEEARAAASEGRRAKIEIDTGGSDVSGGAYSIDVLPVAGGDGLVAWRIEDVTTRRRSEEVLREERARAADFLDNAPVGFYSVDNAGRFLVVNRTLADWLGADRADLIEGKARLHDFVAGPPIAGRLPHDPFGGHSGDHAGEVRLRRRDGTELHALVSQTVVYGSDGSLRTRSAVRDLTHEREIEDALARTERSFRRFFDEAPVGNALLDAEGRIVEANRAFQALIGGETAIDLRGKSLADLVRAEDRAETGDRLRHVAQGRTEAKREAPRLVVFERGGRETTVALYATRIEGGGPEDSSLIVHAVDVTEQKRLEVQFAQSQKMQAVGQLAGGIAHDFNNLLTAMIGFCDLLLLRHAPGDPSFADIMQVKQNANRAANLVRHLLAFSRQQTLQLKTLDVTDALSELSHLLRRLIGANIELKLQHGRDLHLVRVDQGQLEQVIINLAVNARDAMPGGGKLVIRTANRRLEEPMQRGGETVPAGDYVAIEATDTGVGISPEIVGRIFEPFFSTKEVGSGTGLGLSTVYGIVKQSGGFVFVDSKLGEGATFTVLLPRFAGERASAVAAEVEPARRDLTGAGTVLLVEDEDAVRLFSARALRNKGYKVVEAKSGEIALKLLGEHDKAIDLVVTDVMMPEMDGTQLIKAVRERRPEMRIVCISGYAEETFRKRLDSAADIHFLPKPFSLDQLAGKVKEVMRQAG